MSSTHPHTGKTSAKPSIKKNSFGTTPEGEQVSIYTLTNGTGAEARILDFGGILQSLIVPDRKGVLADVVLGYDDLKGYLTNPAYLGATIGRYGNRIAKGQFSLDGVTYKLAANNGQNHLHGGIKGFDKVVWKANTSVSENGASLQLTYVSKDGEEGYPGNLSVTMTYTFQTDNALRIDFVATTDQKSVCNLTHHSYFNFKGCGDILDHVVKINAIKTTAVDHELIPTGGYAPVEGTPFDFRKETVIGARINDPDQFLQYGPGYDHNWVINKPLGEMGLMATVSEPSTGRAIEVWSNAPGVQFYAGNFLDGTITGKGGKVYARRNGFCFEPQHYPDSPNHPGFPTTVLEAGGIYQHSIIYKFATR